MSKPDRTVVSLAERRRAAERAARPPRRSLVAALPRLVGLAFAAAFWLTLAAGLGFGLWRLVSG